MKLQAVRKLNEAKKLESTAHYNTDFGKDQSFSVLLEAMEYWAVHYIFDVANLLNMIRKFGMKYFKYYSFHDKRVALAHNVGIITSGYPRDNCIMEPCMLQEIGLFHSGIME